MIHYTPDRMAEKYYILDTTIGYDHTADVEAMNGRQGDNMRSIAIAFTDDGQPHNLTDTKITLKVLDASGVVKVSDKIINLVDAKAGLVIFGVPDRVYESVGQVQRAYFTLEDKLLDGSTQTISTVNVSFRVLENGIDITKAQSSIYISALDRVIGSAGAVLTASGDNHLTGHNVIDNLTVKNLVNDEVEQIKTSLSAKSSDITANSQAIVSNSTAISSLNSDVKSAQTAISTVSDKVATQSSSVTNLSSVVSDLSNSLDETNDDVTSLSNAVKSAANSENVERISEDVTSLSNVVSQMSNTVSQASYQIAVNSLTTSFASSAVNAFMYLGTTGSEIYQNSALSFLDSFLRSVDNDYQLAKRNIH